jgi:hypothetical protein
MSTTVWLLVGTQVFLLKLGSPRIMAPWLFRFRINYEALYVWTYYSTPTPTQWPRGLRRGSAAARLLGLRARTSHRWHGCLSLVSVCVLSGGGLCRGLITRPEGSCRMCSVSQCDLETSKRRRPRPDLGCCATGKKNSTRILFRSIAWPLNAQVNQHMWIYMHTPQVEFEC